MTSPISGEPMSGAAATQPALPSALTVLLVDDNPDDRLLTERQLKEHIPQATVLEAGDAQSLAHALTLPFDVVITDYELRWSKGTEVLRTVKQRFPDRPVIMFTASGSEEVAAAAMKEGLDDYITKTPKHYRRIPHAVLACYERSNQRAQLRTVLERERLAMARLHVALQSARMATWQLDLRSGQREYSEDVGPLFGRPRGFVHADDQAWLSDVHPKDRVQVLERLHAAIRSHTDYRAEYRTLGPDGVQRWVQSSGRVLLDESGAATLMIGAVRDVTEWVATREALREQQEELRTIFDVMPVGVAVSHDRFADHVSFTPYFARLLGLPDTRTAFDGTSRAPFTLYRNGAKMRPEEWPMKRATHSGERIAADEVDVVSADGRSVTILCNAAPLFDDEGEVRGAVCVMVDVTDLKRARQELERADRQKNEFLATLAHELRNPLAPIRYSVALLQTGASAATLGKAREIIERQTAHMARLLDDLLDLSRITRNKVDLVLTTLDLRRVIELGYENARDLLDQNRHAVDLSLPAEPLWVHGDEVRLTQVVSNLLNNAAKFTPSGGRVAVAAVREGAHTIVRVRDTGIGIAEQDLPRIFDMFSQASSKVTGASPGLGIGLAVVRSIVRMHGGEVKAHSGGLGAGSEFCIELPLSEPPQTPAPARADSAQTRLVGCRVLVVDDNRDAADALADLLQTAGCATRVAYDGEEAQRVAGEFRPNSVILDIGMPRANGFEVAKWIRAEPWGKDVYLTAVTGWGQQEDRAATHAAGFDAHLVKPVTPAEILRLIQQRCETEAGSGPT